MKGQIFKNEEKNVDEKKECWLMFSLGFKVYVFNVWEYAWSNITKNNN
jgi:hypothetical protein